MPGGPRNDPTKIREGPFPPVGHSEAEPIIGAPATEMSAPVLRAATVTAVEEGAQKVTARVEYRKRPVVFTRRFDGSYRMAGAPDDYATRLFIGVRASNLKTYKLWWSEGDLSVGPIVD